MTAKLACTQIRLYLLHCQISSLYLSETNLSGTGGNMINFSGISTFYAKLTALSEISTQMNDSIDGMKTVN